MSPAEFQWALTYQISPIFLQDGIAGGAMGGTMPIIYLLQGSGFPGLGFPGVNVSVDDYFAQFIPLPGSDLVNNEFGTYPFANQQTAANAVITLPLSISMMMICPARQPGDYFTKQQIISSLADTLNQHSLSGGTYIVNTPARVWGPCLLKSFRDMTGYESKQVQWRWQLDFIEPLTSSSQAAATAQSAFMSSLSNGQNMTPGANGALSLGTGGQQPSTPGAGSGASVTAVPSASTNPASFGPPAPYYTPPLSNTTSLPPNSIGNPTPTPAAPPPMMGIITIP